MLRFSEIYAAVERETLPEIKKTLREFVQNIENHVAHCRYEAGADLIKAFSVGFRCLGVALVPSHLKLLVHLLEAALPSMSGRY